MSLKNNKILITGATGYIGEHVVRKLINEGLTPSLASRDSNKLHKDFSHLPFHSLDIQDFQAVNELLSSYEIVIHLAGRTGKGHIEDPINDFNINAVGSLNLLKASVNNHIYKFITLSSYEVYGLNQPSPINEKYPCQPTTPYGASILTRETYANVFRKTYSLPTIVFRLFNAYGWPISENNKKGIISYILSQSMANAPITITANPENSFDFIYINDIVEIVFAALIKNDFKQHCFNLASGVSTNLKNLVKIVQSLTHHMSTVNFQYEQKEPPLKIQADISNLKNEFNHLSFQNLEKNINKMLLEKSIKGAAI